MRQPLTLTFCGTPTLILGDQPLTGLLTGKTLALFVYLAATGQTHTRDGLTDLLWSDLLHSSNLSNPSNPQLHLAFLLLQGRANNFRRQNDLPRLTEGVLAGPTQHGSQTGQQNIDLNRFDDIIICAKAKGKRQVIRMGKLRQDDDRQGSQTTESSEERKALRSSKCLPQQHRVNTFAGSTGKRLLFTGCNRDNITRTTKGNL